MDKKTKTLLMVGGGVVVAYLVYKAMTKPKDETETASFANAIGRTYRGAKPKTRCKRSPESYQVLTAPDGTKVYECCGAGMYGLAPGQTPCLNVSQPPKDTLEPASRKSNSVFFK
jgi:hypothetical protein